MLYDAVVVMYNISCVRPKRKPTIIILHTFWQDYVGVVKQLPPILRQHDTYPPHTSSLVGMLISVTRHTHPVYRLLPTIYKVYSVVCPTSIHRTAQDSPGEAK